MKKLLNKNFFNLNIYKRRVKTSEQQDDDKQDCTAAVKQLS
jgi:hypothetical protein